MNLYESLFYGGTMGASELAKKAGLSRTSVYDLLEKLLQVGLISESLKGGVKVYSVQPPEKLSLLVEEKEKEVLEAKKELLDLKNLYQSSRQSVKPRLQMYEGKEELQQMMKDLLLYRDITVHAVWPVKKIISLLGASFLEEFHRKRVERNIMLKVIWPSDQVAVFKQYSFLKIGQEQKREVRLAPSSVNFSLGYAIYGNTVRFISSSKENFGFLIESIEMTEMMRSQFELIWKASRQLR